MYDESSLGGFSNSETRLKQLMLRLKEQEQANQLLKTQVRTAKSDIEDKQKKLGSKKANQVQSNIQSIMQDINGLVQENISLKKS
jgi:YesN/AraC family two-component response regulator